MTAEQWQAAYELLETAGRLPADERVAYIQNATSDSDVQSEVLAMLEDLAPVEAPEPAPAAWRRLGQTIGRFVVTGAVGRGGMGEVYSAHDAELNRTVALKFLSVETSTDGRTAERFIREARAASALNHPNIATVYEVVRVLPAIAIVMELIDGVALRHHCGRENPARQVANWGRQIAEALTAAHAAGIVHRDIKPENVMLRPDGYIKVLDFGLARQFLGPDRSSASITTGTFRYMSPEQTRGEKVNAASDVFSLGIVLYELATGVHPFEGTSPLETAHFIASKEPVAPSAVNRSLPSEFEGLILSMLRKAPDERPSAATVAKKLEAISTSARLAIPKRRSWRVWAAAAVATAVVLAVAVLVFKQRRESTQSAAAAETTKLWGVPLTDLTGHETNPAFSPDGDRIAYAWDRGDGHPQRDIYVKRIGAGDPLSLTRNEADEFGPRWSPDGRRIAFLRRTANDFKVVVIPVEGGAETVVGSLNTEGPVKPRLTWSPDGQGLIIADDPSGQTAHLHLYRLDIQSGERSLLTSPPAGSDVAPAYSPDGRMLAFLRSLNVTYAQLYIIDPNGKERRVSGEAQAIDSFGWARDGRSLTYAVGRNTKELWRAYVDGGTPKRMSLSLAGDYVSELSIAPDGRRLAYTLRHRDSNIWMLDTTASTRPRKLTLPATPDEDPRYSPDGTQFAFTSTRSGDYEIWVSNADGSGQRAVTGERAFCGSPSWSPDGREIAFDGRIGGFSEIWIVSARGGKPRRLVEPPVEAIVPYWSRDGRWVYFMASISGSAQIWKAPVAGGKPIQVTRNGGFEARESPDGKYLYYSKSADIEIWRMPLAGGGEERIAEIGSLGALRYWDLSGSGIFYVIGKPRPMLRFFDFETRRGRDISAPPKPPSPLWRGLSASPDGKSVLYVQYDNDRQEIVIVNNFG